MLLSIVPIFYHHAMHDHGSKITFTGEMIALMMPLLIWGRAKYALGVSFSKAAIFIIYGYFGLAASWFTFYSVYDWLSSKI